MAGFTVEYLINLRDAFSAAAERVAKTSAEARKALGALGETAASVDGKIDKLAQGMNAALRGSSTIAANAKQISGAYVGVGKAADESSKKIAAFRAEAQKRWDSKFSNNPRFNGQQPAVAPIPARSGSDPRSWNIGGKLMNLWFGAQLAEMGVHAADTLVESSAAVDNIARQMQFVGLNKDQIARAKARAEDLSRQTGNMSVAENMQLIFDARSNLIGSFDDILGDVSAFSKLGSFFKAWDGGKHAGAERDLLKELSMAMRSGELAGNVTAENLSKSVNALAAMKALYGDKLSIAQYFTAQKAAGAAFPGADDTFKYIDFPSLVQIMGPGAGTGFSTLMSKTLAGIRMRATSADAWAKAGLVDPHAFGVDSLDQLPKHWQKNLPVNWLVGSDRLGSNPFRWMMNDVLPHLGALGVKGIDSAAILKAMSEGNSEGLRQAIAKIDQGTLFSALGKLGYDKTAVQEMMQFINRAPMILRDEQLMQMIGTPDDFENYAKAKENLVAQANRFWVALTGEKFVPWVTHNINQVSAAFSRMADAAKNVHSLGDALKGLGEWAKTKLFNKDGNITPLGVDVHGWMMNKLFGTDALVDLKRYNAIRKGDALRAYGAHLTPTELRLEESQRRVKSLIAEAEALKAKYHPAEPTPSPTFHGFGPRGGAASAADAAAAGKAAAAQKAQAEVHVRTTLDPIKVTASPLTVNVKVSGKVDAVQGSGSGSTPLATTHPRGRSMADPEAPKVSQ